ncbi:hypothetical protein [Neosynechococcus sphagnicola]|uniref:hypothetical protein n=1 Tax=Neosynechococcus sphagnicola TaxID=1501145 RepID=UPI0012E0364F|nr:hypothetical protein [Neosynechococcus sphagnicola]
MLLVEEATSLGLEQRVASFLFRKSDERGIVAMSQETIADRKLLSQLAGQE